MTVTPTTFPSDYAAIIKQIDAVDAVQYAKTRNYLNGSVSKLSPYLTHGVISTKDVLERILERYTFKEAEKFIFELAWRDFFQSVYRWHGEAIHQDLKHKQSPVSSFDLPQAVLEAQTGIKMLDEAITDLYQTGYVHNHARMWLASLVCNVAQTHWQEPAAWLYYHLLDGDLASNTLSWQWVSGSFASKKYYANQDNLNKYSNVQQQNTLLDLPYSAFPNLAVPESLKKRTKLELKTTLPKSTISSVPRDKTVLLYHMWMLDPKWQANTSNVTRILILEPSQLKKHPMSQKRIDFILNLANNIRGLNLFVGELEDLEGLADCSKVLTQAHPSIQHWSLELLKKEQPLSMFQPDFKNYPSFFAYWKACQKTDLFRTYFS